MAYITNFQIAIEVRKYTLHFLLHSMTYDKCYSMQLKWQFENGRWPFPLTFLIHCNDCYLNY